MWSPEFLPLVSTVSVVSEDGQEICYLQIVNLVGCIIICSGVH